MTVIDTTAVNTTSVQQTVTPTTTTAETSADIEAQTINNDTRDDAPISRKFGVSTPTTPTTGTIKSEMKEIYCGGSLLEAVQKAKIFHDCKHFVDMPLKIDAGQSCYH